MGCGVARVAHHPEYYLSDGSVSFLCKPGGILFRVHKTNFERESAIFRELFASAQSDDPESGTDKSPFILDITPEDFSQFLWVWYNRDYSFANQTKDKWGTILRLAKRWGFHKIQELAVRELEALELQPAERISFYNEHDIDGEKLLQSYIALCRSPTIPTEADARLMKMETLIKVLQAREHAHLKAIEDGHQTPTSASLDDDALMEIISKHFKKRLTPQSGGTTTGSRSQASNLNGTSTTNNTIIVRAPQAPGEPANLNSSLPTSKTKESTEKQQERGAGKSATKEAEKGEKVAGTKGGKEKEEKDKQEKVKQEKEARKASTN